MLKPTPTCWQILHPEREVYNQLAGGGRGEYHRQWTHCLKAELGASECKLIAFSFNLISFPYLIFERSFQFLTHECLI